MSKTQRELKRGLLIHTGWGRIGAAGVGRAVTVPGLGDYGTPYFALRGLPFGQPPFLAFFAMAASLAARRQVAAICGNPDSERPEDAPLTPRFRAEIQPRAGRLPIRSHLALA